MNLTMSSSVTLPSSYLFPTSEEIQIDIIRNLFDTLHEQYHTDWTSTLLMNSDDYSKPNSINCNVWFVK